MNSTPARRAVPRLAAAATVTAALVAGGAAATTVQKSAPEDAVEVVALVNAWPKKYTGVGIAVEPAAGTVTEG
jgi:hypothetical protein